MRIGISRKILAAPNTAHVLFWQPRIHWSMNKSLITNSKRLDIRLSIPQIASHEGQYCGEAGRYGKKRERTADGPHRRQRQRGGRGPDQVKRDTGLINNQLYIGRLVWNRLRYVKNPETGKQVSRINPHEEWIVTEVPELRIVGDALWQAVEDRQEELTAKYATVIEATRQARANRLNGTHRPRHLLSGLLECGACGGPYAMRGQDRYGCSNHVMNGSCSNGRGIRRTVLKERVLVGLKDRLMAPDVAAEAVRAWAEETNRLNRERCASGEADRKELADIEKKMATMISVIEDGGYVKGMIDRLREMEARQEELNQRLAAVPAEIPDIHPNIAGVYRRKVARLAEALRNPEERNAAAAAIRGLIERIVLTPGAKRGDLEITLRGDLGTILEWTGNGAEKEKTDTPASGMSVSVVAWTRTPNPASSPSQ